MDKIAYIDLSKSKFATKNIPEEIKRKYLGGRGLNAYLLYNHIEKGIDPISPDNVLVFGAGLFSGHLGIATARFHVSAKSPETGIIGDSNCGGFWAPELRYAGFQHLVIKEKAERPTYLWVHDGEIEFRDASHLWGLDTFDTQERLRQELNDPNVQIVCIGQAGERLVRFANVRHGFKRSAGRTGMGCVMGSKQLKAIAVRGRQGLKIAHPGRLLEITHKHLKQVIGTKMYPILSRYGTLFAFVVQNECGQLACYNHQYNRIEIPEGTLEAEVFDEKYKIGSFSCLACPIHCTHRYRIKSGPYAGTWGEGPEWYLMGGFGPQLGNLDWEVILVANDLCNRYGIDVGSTSAYTAWLMELYQRGIIDKKFTGGLSLEWGNKEAIIELIHQIANRKGLGALLANGWREAAKKIGKGCERYMAHSKWLPVEQHDSRALRATALGEITSNRGHDHLRGRVNTEWMGLPEDFLEKMYGKPVSSDPTSWDGKAWMATWTQYLFAVVDALNICKFATKFFGPGHLGFEEFCEALNAITGWDMNKDELMKVGERIWTLEKLFNVREGLGREGDMPPEAYYEPNPLEPRKGLRTDPDKYEKQLDEYYEIHGWDVNGIPKSETLKRLGLDAKPMHIV